MLSIGVNIRGDAAFMKKLERAAVDFLDWKEALEETGHDMTDYFAGTAFNSQGGVFGTPWAALSPSTVAYKSKHYRTYAAVPLMRTGDMRKQFRSDASATHLEITNDSDHFKYHQSTKPRHKIPRRPMLGINRDVREIIRRVFRKAALKKLAGL